ncbi:MAG: GNAT family N-acetyltransferase [Methylococcales bacterium]
MKVQIYTDIDEIPAAIWNRLVKDNHPVLRHEFLAAMERHGCVGENFGWIPCHIGITEKNVLIGVMPLYQKYNSLGEFVFDHAWANAYDRMSIPYFPKLVSAVPYTPALGQRLLALPGRETDVFPLLLESVLHLAEQIGASSFHCLFPDEEEHRFFEESGLFTRHDCQFHWHNPGYQNFEDFLSTLTARKRKNIRQERRRVEKTGVVLRILDGHTATDEDWHNFNRFYIQNFVDKWGIPTFNEPFFNELGNMLPDQIVLVLADSGAACIAGALMYHSNTTLYGRHWGCIQSIDSLHFEVCFYQGIEYCIRHGLQHFEPGAQGEHKIARGFIPTLTHSSHWLADSRFHAPVAEFVRHEQNAVAQYMRQLQSTLPYKRV